MDLSGTLVEIVELVVGILAALWVNNWNQRRLDGRKGHTYIESLRGDVAKDVETLRGQIEFADGTAEAARALLHMLRRQAELADGNNLLRLLKRAGTMYPFRPTKTTFQELSGGGNLSLVEDRELERALAMVLDSDVLVRESLKDLHARAARLLEDLEAHHRE